VARRKPSLQNQTSVQAVAGNHRREESLRGSSGAGKRGGSGMERIRPGALRWEEWFDSQESFS